MPFENFMVQSLKNIWQRLILFRPKYKLVKALVNKFTKLQPVTFQELSLVPFVVLLPIQKFLFSFKLKLKYVCHMSEVDLDFLVE